MTAQPFRVLGAVLAGGQSSRFGSDKGAAEWQGQSLLSHSVQALRDTCDEVVICGGSNEDIAQSPAWLQDIPESGLGPLGGLCAALAHAREHEFDAVLSVPVDAHPVPDGLLDRLAGEGPAALDRHWLFGFWPSDLAGALEDHLQSGSRSVLSWIEACGARMVDYAGREIVNVNTPAALDALEAMSALGAAADVYGAYELAFETGQAEEAARIVPVEVPVAIEYNGIGYAVMMATPTDLEDFVTGFSLSEGLARQNQIGEVSLFETGGGWIARANLPASSVPRVAERARSRVSESGCGICGIDSIAAALAPLDPVTAQPRADHAAVHQALSAMRSHQDLGRATGAAHAAAFCSFDGEIMLLREDVGRHNALDKLIGALDRQGVDHEQGFVLLSARCSQELVEKTVRCGIPMLVTISAPSTLAIKRAREGRLTLITLARSDTALVMNDPHGLFPRRRRSAKD
ncbi:MAG: hypothetical protein CL949_08185 [Erythrobacter sp.]|nr:hypothetical protein [Erythrobacter sp.]